jgi:hypothetical protein
MPINPITGLTYSEDITESSSSYTYKTARVTAVSGNGTTITYTAANTFVAGDVIDVTGSDIAGYNKTTATVATASATQFTITGANTGTNTSTSVVAFTASSVTPNIDLVYDLTYVATNESFDLTDVAYDVSIADIPFILKVDNQNPYRRETAQYKKDQFDTSREPGEQSLTGWWVRSQTSWHNGAGIEFYEPGTDFEYTANRFHDSRGVDIWTTGELRLHKDVFHAYTGAQGINAATAQYGKVVGGETFPTDVLVSGDANGILKRIELNGNSTVVSDSTVNYVHTATSYPQGHNGSNFPFTSVTTSGGKYYATCTGAIHRGNVGDLSSDVVFARHDGGDTAAFVKYAKGFVFFGEDNILHLLDDEANNTNAHSGALPGDKQTDSRKHLDPFFIWRDVTAGPTSIYACGDAGNNSEIWKIGFDTPAGGTNTTLLPDLSGSTMNVSLPDGEIVKAMYYYLGYLAVGTTKGVRVCPINDNGDIVLGPLVIETAYAVNGFTTRGTYLYAATKANATAGNTNGILIRIDLSQQFSDGTFAHAYDLEYQSTPDNSDCTEVYNLDDRIVMVIQENGAAGELQVEHTTNYRSSGYLQTGKIRYGTVEPKFFKYLQTRGLVATGDSITVETIDYAGNKYDIINLDSVSLEQNIALNQPTGGQEFISIRYTLNNGSPITDYPVLQSYQLKAVPGVPRQRIYQFPLSCFDTEMDKYNASFGYRGRAHDVVQKLEELEAIGDFVQIKDFRTDESFEGVIEEVRFTNESSPDKDSNGYGGLLLVTVRKL